MFWGFPSGSLEKNPPAMQETQERRVPSLSWEDPMKKEITTLSSILAWKIPWKEEPGRRQSMGHNELGTTEQLSTLDTG